MDWNDLRLVLEIARAGSLAGAARTLGVNHSTVFRRLNAFERGMGLRVFERLPEGYLPTPEGEAVRAQAEQMEAAALALERDLAGADLRLCGSVRLTTAPNLAVDYVAPLLPALRERHPDIRLEISAGDRDYDLARREADLALRATSTPPQWLVGRQLAELPWLVCAGRRYLDGRQAPRSMADLAAHAVIGAEPAFLRLPAFAWLQANLPESCFVARAGDLNTMAALAAVGLGLAVLPIDQRHAELVPLFPMQPDFRAGLWLLTHPDLRRVARVRAVYDFLAEALMADPRLLVAPQAASAALPSS